MTKTAAVYLRISSSQDGENVSHSVQYQQDRCEALARAAGYTVKQTYVDDGYSAYVKGQNRPGWKKLRQAVSGGEFDLLVFDRQDRLARDQFEIMDFISACGRQGVAWHSVDEGEINLTDPLQVMMSVLRGGQAQEYSAKISKNASKGNAARRSAGRMFASGAVPFGYNDDRLTLNEPEADLIRRGVAMVNAGQGLMDVVRMFRASGVKPRRSEAWQYVSVRDMLTPWRNAGVVSYRGEPTEQVGQWTPIVTREELEAARAILLGRGGEKRIASRLMSGIAICGACGEVLTGANRAGKANYACSAKNLGLHQDMKHVAIQVKILDPLVRKAVIDSYFMSSPGALPTNADDVAALGRLHARIREVRQGIEDAQESIGQPGYTKARVDKVVARLAAEEQDLAAQIVEHAERSAHSAMLVDSYALITTKTSWDDADKHWDALAARFDSLTFDQQRTLVRALVHVTVHPGKGEERVEIVHTGVPALDVEGDPDGNVPW